MNEHRLARLAPLAGVAYAVATIAGDLVIGEFPDTGASTVKLHAYYAAHHGHVAAGGMIFAWSTLLLAVFGCALWSRVRAAGGHVAVAAAVLVGTAVAVAETAQEASGFLTLGDAATKAGVSPSALQALHVSASAGALGAGMAILLLAVGSSRIVPRWLAWPAVVLGLLQLTPVGFFASLAFLLWAAVAGVILTLRQREAMVPAVVV
jgi:hypothetical protein